jgi:hypothetical protein
MDEGPDPELLLQDVLNLQHAIADGLLAAATAARRMAAELEGRAIMVPGPTALEALAKELVAAADQRLLAVMPAAGTA